MSLLPNRIRGEESLFRIIRAFPRLWNFKIQRPTPAAFKRQNGLSVDRSWDRCDAECVKFLQDNQDSRSVPKFVAAVSIKAEKARKMNLVAEYKPSTRNIYHSELWEVNKGRKLDEISDPIALKLSDLVEVHDLFD